MYNSVHCLLFFHPSSTEMHVTVNFSPLP